MKDKEVKEILDFINTVEPKICDEECGLAHDSLICKLKKFNATCPHEALKQKITTRGK